MNNSGGVLFLAKTFKDHKVTLRLFVLDKVVDFAFCLHHKGVGSLTNFTLKGLPEEGREVLRGLGLLASLEPG